MSFILKLFKDHPRALYIYRELWAERDKDNKKIVPIDEVLGISYQSYKKFVEDLNAMKSYKIIDYKKDEINFYITFLDEQIEAYGKTLC